MPTVKDLYDFIDTAVRSRKYPTSTAQGLRAAVKLFDAELNDDERSSLDLLKSHIEQIYQSVFTKNKNDFSVASIATYKSRFLKVINHYERYGTDPTKMANWTPTVVARSPRSAKKDTLEKQSVADQPGAEVAQDIIPADVHRIELALRPDKKFILIVPYDLKESESTILKAILTSLTISKDDHVE